MFVCLFYFFLVVLHLHCCRGFSLVVESRAYSLVVVLRLLLAVAAFVVEHGLWGMQDSVVGLVGSRAQAQQLWHTGLVAPQHVGSSQTRDRTRVCCIDRQILYHWATREALFFSIYVPTILKYTYPQVVLDSILFLEVKFFFPVPANSSHFQIIFWDQYQ